ncbi:helix-turn-helix domain-containing protein [Enterococcus sp. LJL98]
MAKLQIDSVDLAEEAFQPIVQLIGQSIKEAFEREQRRKELPLVMNKKQACEYLNVSYNTLMNVYVPNGLKISIVDGIERIRRESCDEFMKKHEI